MKFTEYTILVGDDDQPKDTITIRPSTYGGDQLAIMTITDHNTDSVNIELTTHEAGQLMHALVHFTTKAASS